MKLIPSSITVYDKTKVACKTMGRDIMLAVQLNEANRFVVFTPKGFKPTVSFFDLFLTNAEAEELAAELLRQVGKNKQT